MLSCPELLSPAGSLEALKYAVMYGADAVYCALPRFGMRAAPVNLTIGELHDGCIFAHARGKKVYLTLNNLPTNDELSELPQYIKDAAEAGVDAFIIADLGVLSLAKQYAPDVDVHFSTQAGSTNYAAATMAYNLGAKRVVLARELSLEQVAAIRRRIVEDDIRGPRGELVEIEMFAHGALCMSVSGKCYLSLYETNCSANRGACRQLCRRKYTVTDKETGAQLDIDGRYVLSPKDLCTIDFLDKMIAAGVRVLKIEGRARGAEYVKRVVECYDQALKAMESGTYTPALTAELKERLRTVFNRGFWEGYYAGRPVVEHSPAYGSSATQRKVYVGKVTNFYRKLSVAEVSVEAAPLAVGEPIFFLGATTGVAEQTLTELHGPDGQPAESVAQGELCAIRTPGVVRRGDQLYKFVPAETT